MSQPAKSPPSQPANAADGPRPPRRYRPLDGLSAVLLFATVGAVFVSAFPSLVRATGAGETSSSPLRSVPHPPIAPDPLGGARLRPRADGDPQGAPGGGQRPFIVQEDEDEEDPSAAPSDHGGVAADRPVVGEARGPFQVFAGPSDKTPLVGTVRVGEMVSVQPRRGGWAFVIAAGEQGSRVTGFARKSEIAVR